MKNKLKSIITFILIIIIFALCITITQLPGIYAYPTEYADYNGLIISENDDLQQIFVDEYFYSFRTVNDSMERPYSSTATSSNPANTFIAEFQHNNSKYGTILKINNYNNPYPNIQIPEDYRNNESLFWEYIFTISKYWKVYTNEQDFYGTPMFFLKPYNYIEPEYKIECNPTEIAPGETSTCELKVTYHSKIKSLNFKLDTDQYNISDVKSGEDFENLQVNDGLYSISSKNTLEDSEEGRTTTILSFTIKSDSDVVASSDNIKVLDLEYDDELSESPKKVATATVNQNKKEKADIKNIVNNPKTRNNIILIILLLTLIISSIIISSKNKARGE